MLPSSILLFAMAAYIPPLVWGQSSSSSSVSRPATLTATSPTPASSSATASTSTAVVPRILFNTIDTLVACDQAEVSWEVFGIRGDLYSVALYVVDSDYAAPSSSAAVSTSVSPRSVAPSSTSAAAAPRVTTSAASPVASSASSSAGPSTSLVGRALYPRQSPADTNITLTTDHAADEAYGFTVAIPAGSYYIIAQLDDPLQTSARSNLFSVIERSNTSCLADAGLGGSGSSSSSTRTSITGGIMQTPGAGSSDSSTSSGPSGGAIAGIVIGALGGLAILAFLAFFCIRRRRRAAAGTYATREMGQKGADNRFAALPSASSQDGQYAPGVGGAMAAGRRDSDMDEKDVEAANSHDEHYTTLDRAAAAGPHQHPFPGTFSGNREIMTSPELDPPPALGDRRRQSGPPTTHTLVPKTSMQGIIGKASGESSAAHSRSSSSGGDGTPASGSGSGPFPPVAGSTSTAAKEGVTRSASAKRKPVPSLGPELRGELAREKERKMSESSGQRKPSITNGSGAEVRRSYSLVPDPLPSQPHS